MYLYSFTHEFIDGWAKINLSTWPATREVGTEFCVRVRRTVPLLLKGSVLRRGLEERREVVWRTAPFECKTGGRGFDGGSSLEAFNAATSCSASTHFASSCAWIRASSSLTLFTLALCNSLSDISDPLSSSPPPCLLFAVEVGAWRTGVAATPPGWYTLLSKLKSADCADPASRSSRSLRRADPHCVAFRVEDFLSQGEKGRGENVSGGKSSSASHSPLDGFSDPSRRERL